jgi:hypothetical protein
MKLSEFVPENDLEVKIMEARSGKIGIDVAISEIIKSEIFMMNKSEIEDNWMGFDPLLVDHKGMALICILTSISRTEMHQGAAQFVLRIIFSDLLRIIPDNIGAAINPGYSTQLIITPNEVASLRSRLS